jgi:hypothetical protein
MAAGAYSTDDAGSSRRSPGRRPARHGGQPTVSEQTLITGARMNIHLALTPLISLVAGILILVVPRLLNFIVAIYLIAIGLIGLFGAQAMRLA